MAYNDKNLVNDYSGHKIPQYYNPVTDKYEPLHGADGVSFVGNHVLSPGGVWIPQTGNDDGSINTRVTGSIVEEIKIFNSVKIRDTSNHWKWVDLSMFKSFTLIANSTLNEYPTITYRTPNASTPNRVFKNEEWVGTGSITIEDTVNRSYLLNSFWTEFTDTPYASIAFRVQCDVAPTQGEFSLSAWGVLR